MDISKLKTFSRTHVLQSTQTMAFVTFEDLSHFVGIYDSSTGHWLRPGDMEEVGYLSVIRPDAGPEKRVIYIKEYVTNHCHDPH